MLHALKTHPEYFEALKSGEKAFELRKDDRPFEVGDTFLAQEYDPEKEQYSGEEVQFKISYILRDAQKFGLKTGYCILGLIEKKVLPIN